MKEKGEGEREKGRLGGGVPASGLLWALIYILESMYLCKV